jgi:hypothetical protein
MSCALAAGLLAAAGSPLAGAQETPQACAPPIEQQGAPAELAAQEPRWSIGLEVYRFDPDDDDPYVAPILRADRGALHLEARYQYEDLDTGSFFVGRSFSFGDELALDLVPMVGLVVGETDGIAPGLEAELAWKALAWYVESEYLIDLHDRDDNYLYTWSELTLSPTEWLRFGLVAQRTRVFDQELDVDRGLLLGLTAKRLRFGLYAFNLDQDDEYIGLSLGFGG